jgi:drug/metabolite transporter (DMT)-like permease
MLYSSTGIFSKLTSTQDFLSLGYLFFFSMIIVILAIYSVLWQLILKKVPLAQAYLFKSTGGVFALLYAHFLFNEPVSVANILGMIIIFIGIVINSYRIAS